MNMQIDLCRQKLDFLEFNSAYKDTLGKQTRVLDKLQSRYKKLLEKGERISQQVSLLGLQIEAQAKLLRDL